MGVDMAEVTWTRGTVVLVANGTRARLCRVHGGHAELLGRRMNELGRTRERDLVSDRPGRYQAGGQLPGGGRGLNPRSAFEPMHLARSAALDMYARDLAEDAAHALRAWSDHGLAVVAPPALLGRLRQHLEDGGRLVVAVPADYTSYGNERLLAALAREGVPGAAVSVPG
jgi:protein required for attachment to host cells